MTTAPLQTIVLVSCVAKKLVAPALAADLYQSQWFKAARAYAEAHGNHWYILSAKYGLVHPDQSLLPYEQTLPGSHAKRRCWAELTAKQLRLAIEPQNAKLVILAGLRYRYPLMEYLKDYTVAVPMYALGIGQQLRWLHQHNKEVSNGT